MPLTLSLTADKREFIRLPFRIKVTFEVPGKKTKLDMYTRDVSAGGLGLELAVDDASIWRRLKKDATILRLQFKLPGDRKPTICHALVMWKGEISTRGRKKYFLGLSFTDLDNSVRLRISKIIRAAFIDRLNKEYKKLKKKK